MQPVILDGFDIEHRTAANMTKLCKMRGVEAEVVYDEEKKQYIANGTPCGPSIIGVEEWLKKQPGVKP